MEGSVGCQHTCLGEDMMPHVCTNLNNPVLSSNADIFTDLSAQALAK
jgi:hypothetical protein